MKTVRYNICKELQEFVTSAGLSGYCGVSATTTRGRKRPFLVFYTLFRTAAVVGTRSNTQKIQISQSLAAGFRQKERHRAVTGLWAWGLCQCSSLPGAGTGGCRRMWLSWLVLAAGNELSCGLIAHTLWCRAGWGAWTHFAKSD